jgi:hypothetical protein
MIRELYYTRKNKTVMKAFFLSVSLCILIGTAVIAQNNPRSNQNNPVALQESPLVIIDSFTTDIKHVVLNPDKILSIDVLKDSSTVSRFGEKARYGVIIIQPKKEANFISLNKLLDEFHITGADRGLKVCVDHIFVKDPSKLVIDRSSIHTVSIITDIVWETPQVAGKEERHINLQSTGSNRLPTAKSPQLAH